MERDSSRGKVTELLESWVKRTADPAAVEWLTEQKRRNAIGGSGTDRTFFMSIGQVSRRMGKADLDLNSSDFEEADKVRPGWTPRGWSVDQASRLVLLLSSTSDDVFAGRLEKLCRSADISELLSYYRGLPLFPDQSAYVFRATEGLRSNIKSVFESVAHWNPYPMEQFEENAWNHMVLKAIFIGSPLYPIAGFEKRSNVNLARMLSHYAHERWAASRQVSPELWRGVGLFAHEIESGLSDLGRVLKSGRPVEQKAAMLALRDCPSPEAQAMINSISEDSGKNPNPDEMATWESVSREWMDSQ